MGATKSLYLQEQIRKDELMDGTKTLEITATLIRPTERAVLVSTKIVMVKIKTRLPKSQIIEPDPIALSLVKPGDGLAMLIPRWLAKSNNLTRRR